MDEPVSRGLSHPLALTPGVAVIVVCGLLRIVWHLTAEVGHRARLSDAPPGLLARQHLAHVAPSVERMQVATQKRRRAAAQGGVTHAVRRIPAHLAGGAAKPDLGGLRANGTDTVFASQHATPFRRAWNQFGPDTFQCANRNAAHDQIEIDSTLQCAGAGTWP